MFVTFIVDEGDDELVNSASGGDDGRVVGRVGSDEELLANVGDGEVVGVDDMLARVDGGEEVKVALFVTFIVDGGGGEVVDIATGGDDGGVAGRVDGRMVDVGPDVRG